MTSTPGLVIAGTDSKHYVQISDNNYHFAPMTVGSTDVSRIHGTNERVKVEGYVKKSKCHAQLIKNAALAEGKTIGGEDLSCYWINPLCLKLRTYPVSQLEFGRWCRVQNLSILDDGRIVWPITDSNRFGRPSEKSHQHNTQHRYKYRSGECQIKDNSWNNVNRSCHDSGQVKIHNYSCRQQ
mgnify:FL=1